jgi:hypothetical protein
MLGVSDVSHETFDNPDPDPTPAENTFSQSE